MEEGDEPDRLPSMRQYGTLTLERTRELAARAKEPVRKQGSGFVHTPGSSPARGSANMGGALAILGNTPPEVEGAIQPIVLQSGPNSPPRDQ